VISTGLPLGTAEVTTIGETISKLWISEGHPVNRKTGKRESGGPFHVTHTGPYFKAGNVANIIGGNGLSLKYSGPVIGAFTKSAAIGANYRGTTEEMDSSSMNSDGATAIARVAPTNPTASLSVGLAETFKEGFSNSPWHSVLEGEDPIPKRIGIGVLKLPVRVGTTAFRSSGCSECCPTSS